MPIRVVVPRVPQRLTAGDGLMVGIFVDGITGSWERLKTAGVGSLLSTSDKDRYLEVIKALLFTYEGQWVDGPRSTINCEEVLKAIKLSFVAEELVCCSYGFY